ncbi:MAG: DUF58 domain-containing protein [Candidatus Dormibacteraeota bacterium]|nr:DUF58 domain-containing protein [Candidatus Dormibacteraeota bacterium]
MLPDAGTGGVAVDQLLRRSRWPVLRRLGFHPGGDERSGLRGPGLEYSDVREYQAGDDPRTIEWNITARSDRPYVRESLPDRGLDAWLLVDITRSLDWGTARCLKRQLALEFSAVVGQLLIGRGNRVGALLFDDRVRSIIPPSAGRTALLRLIARMERAADGQQVSAPGGGGPGGGPTNLGKAVTEAGRLVRRPSMMILISDFMTPAGWQQPLSALAIRHEVVAVWITDPREREIPDVGVVTFEDAESGEQILVDTRSAHLRARFQEAAAAQRETIRADLRRARAAVAELSTAAEVVPQLVAFIKQREAQRGGRLARVSA